MTPSEKAIVAEIEYLLERARSRQIKVLCIVAMVEDGLYRAFHTGEDADLADVSCVHSGGFRYLTKIGESIDDMTSVPAMGEVEGSIQ